MRAELEGGYRAGVDFQGGDGWLWVFSLFLVVIFMLDLSGLLGGVEEAETA